MDRKLIEIASGIVKPISLASIITMAFYVVFKAILELDVFETLGETNTFALLNIIADRIFYFALASFTLSIATYTYKYYLNNQQHRIEGKLAITGNILFSTGAPVKDAVVFVEGVDRQKETDDTGWFTIEVNRQDSWIVHAVYGQLSVEMTVTRESINKPLRLILPGNILEYTDQIKLAMPKTQQGIAERTDKDIVLLPFNEDPIKFLGIIKLHLSKQPSGRDSLESLQNSLSPVCQGNLDVAKGVVHRLIYEKYLIRTSGNRYELSQKAHNILSRRNQS